MMTRLGQRIHDILFLPSYTVLATNIMLLGIALSLTRPFLPLFGTSAVGMNPAALGIFMSLSAIGGIVASTVLGKLSDTRMSRKTVILMTAMAGIVGYGAFIWFRNYYVLLVFSVVLVGISSSTFPQMFAYARESLTEAQSADTTFAISTLRSFFSLAWVIGPLIGAWTLTGSNFNEMFLYTSIAFVFVFILSAFRMKQRAAARKFVGSTQHGSMELLKRPAILKSVVAFTAFSMSNTIYAMNTPLFMTHDLHGTVHDAGIVVSLSAGLEIPVMIVLGALARRVSNIMFLMTGCVFGLWYYVSVAFTSAPWQVFVVQVLNATYVAIFVSIGMSYFQDFVPDAPGTATTLFANTSNLGNMLGSLLAGGIAQFCGFRTVYWVCALLGVLTFTLLMRRKTPSVQRGNSVGMSR